MRCLVVHAHPDRNSFNKKVCDTAIAALEATGHDVTLVDLYADQFDARLSQAERLAYEGPGPILDPLVQKYADFIKSTEALVFVYPTWWWGMPAILKGFLERVFVPGVSFSLNAQTKKVAPGLLHIRRIVGITTYGSKRLTMRLFNDSGRRIVMRCVRLLSPSLRTKTTWLGLYGMDDATDVDRQEFLEKVSVAMGDL